MDRPHLFNFRRAVLALVLFGSGFGYLEAAVVSYLRALYEPARQRFHPGRAAGELFPLLTVEEAREAAAGTPQIVAIELGREAATLLMLAGIALAVAGNAGQWAAAFAIGFGVWDITFYVFLRVLLGWPASLATWDILFLLPLPWVGPVAAPVIVSAAMLGAGVFHLWRESRGAPVRLGWMHWCGIGAGALIIIVAFTLDWRNIMAAGMPRPFHWGVFAAGVALGVGSYAAAAARRGLIASGPCCTARSSHS